MTDTKIQGKFYPLQNQEWVRVCKDLTKSQMSILYYLRSLDPYSNGIKVKVSKIAEELDISRKAVYAAITVLEEKKYICLEDIEYSIKVSSGGCLCDTSSIGTSVLPPGDKIHQEVTAVTPGLQDSPGGNNIHPQVTAVTPGLQVEPETQVLQDSQNSKINKTYSDFIKTLSEEERANFLKFCEEKTKNLSQEVNDIEAWLAHTNKAGKNRWEVYYQKYLAAKQVGAKKTATKSALDEFRRELEEKQQQAQRAREQSQNQKELENNGGAT